MKRLLLLAPHRPTSTARERVTTGAGAFGAWRTRTFPVAVQAAICLTAALSFACVTALVPAAEKVQVVSSEEKKERMCEFVSIINVKGTSEWRTQNAFTMARNEAARLGANAIYVVNLDAGPANTYLIAEVLKSDFRRKQ
jgi:hypothetical protein